MMFRIIALAITLLSFSGIENAAEADSLLAGAAGKWKGDGWTRENSKDPKKSIKCRLNFKYSEGRSTLSFSGKCAGGGRPARVSGSISKKSASRYAGQWASTIGKSVSNMLGTRSGNTIRLKWRAKNPKSGRPMNFSSKWSVSRNRLSISFYGGPNGNKILSQLVLRR